jgi:hypothetical protein
VPNYTATSPASNARLARLTTLAGPRPAGPRSISLASTRTIEGLGKFALEGGKVTLDPARTTYQNMVMILQAVFGKNSAEDFAKSTLHAVANDGIADLFRNGDPEPFTVAAIRARQQHKSGPSITQAPVCRKKISPTGQRRKRSRFGHRSE